MSSCWWCGQQADSREHKWPRALLVLEFGDSEEWRAEPVAHVEEGVERIVNGPRSKSLTFTPVLCRKCNNEASQPLDAAVISIGRYVKSNENKILASRKLDWREVQPQLSGSIISRDFVGYIIKFVACTLAQAAIPVPPSFVYYLNEKHQLPPELHLVMQIRKDIADFLIHEEGREGEPTGAVWSGGVSVAPDPDFPGKEAIFGHFTFRFMRVSWTIYLHRSDGGTNFCDDVVDLPERWNVEPHEYPWVTAP